MRKLLSKISLLAGAGIVLGSAASADAQCNGSGSYGGGYYSSSPSSYNNYNYNNHRDYAPRYFSGNSCNGGGSVVDFYSRTNDYFQGTSHYGYTNNGSSSTNRMTRSGRGSCNRSDCDRSRPQTYTPRASDYSRSSTATTQSCNSGNCEGGCAGCAKSSPTYAAPPSSTTTKSGFSLEYLEKICRRFGLLDPQSIGHPRESRTKHKHHTKPLLLGRNRCHPIG